MPDGAEDRTADSDRSTTTPAHISAVLFAHGYELKSCYEQALIEDATLAATVVITARISLRGEVDELDIQLDSNGGRDAKTMIETCFERVFETMQFEPPAREGTRFEKTFMLKTSG